MKNGNKYFLIFFIIVLGFAGCNKIYKYSNVESLPRPAPESPQPGFDEVHIFLPPPEEYAFEIRNAPGSRVLKRDIADNLNLDSPINIKATIDEGGNVIRTENATILGMSKKESDLVEKVRNVIGTWKYTPYATGEILFTIRLFKNKKDIQVSIKNLNKIDKKCKWIGKGFMLVLSDISTTLVR